MRRGSRTYTYMYKCGLRSYEERIANKYRGKDGDDKCAHKYPHAYMPTSHLLQQNLYTYIQTYTSYNSYNLPTYNFYIPSNPYTPTASHPYKPTLHSLQHQRCVVHSRLPLLEYCALRMDFCFFVN